MSPPLTLPRKASYLIFAGAVGAVIWLRLGPVLLAGLLSFMVIDLTYRLISTKLRRLYARGLSVIIFIVVAVALTWMFGYFLRQTISTLPRIAIAATPAGIELAQKYGVQLPFENINELRQVGIKAIRENANQITKTSGILTRGFFHIIIGIFIAVLTFLSDHSKDYPPNLFDSIRRELNERIKFFMLSFERVLGAQVTISLINTTVTAMFLLWMDIPYVRFLIPATFILGILPIIGNVLSNTLIVATAILVSPTAAIVALGFLVFIHKAEYFLNSRIVGGSINAPMWQTLLGILVGEIVLGVPGMILAPTMLHYIKEEMKAIPMETAP